jgi:hypothetical protein
LAIAISANDKAIPNSSALSRPFMWHLPCEAYRAALDHDYA